MLLFSQLKKRKKERVSAESRFSPTFRRVLQGTPNAKRAQSKAKQSKAKRGGRSLRFVCSVCGAFCSLFCFAKKLRFFFAKLFFCHETLKPLQSFVMKQFTHTKVINKKAQKYHQKINSLSSTWRREEQPPPLFRR